MSPLTRSQRLLVRLMGAFNKRPFVRNLSLLLLGLIVVMLRRPDAFLHPQFWAEDGIYFYKPAYDDAVGSLADPYAGSLQTVMRLGGLLAQAFPLSWGPSVFLVIAVVVQLLPILLIHSGRFKKMIPSAWARWLLTLFYLMQPNTWEIHANLTNANWHIAVSAILLLIAATPSQRAWKWFDRLIILVSSLTGPFGFFLLPIAFIKSYATRDRYDFEKSAIILASCLTQVIPLINMPRAATVNPSLVIDHIGLLVKIVGTQIGGVTVLGSNTIGSMPMNEIAAIILFLWILATTALAFAFGSLALRLFIMFGVLTLVASLFRSQTGNLVGLWSDFLAGQGDRYFFIPTIVWFACLLYVFKFKSVLLKSLVAITVFSSAIIAIPADFRMSEKKDIGYYSFADKLEASKKGTVLCNEQNPHTPDKAWLLCLEKH